MQHWQDNSCNPHEAMPAALQQCIAAGQPDITEAVATILETVRATQDDTVLVGLLAALRAGYALAIHRCSTG